MKHIRLLFLGVIVSLGLFATEIPDRPVPPRLVNDLANLLSPNEEQQLERYLVDFARGTSTQIVVVTVPSLNGMDKANFTYQLGEKWGIGQSDKDNGAVMMIKPKVKGDKGEAFIATGYGLEGVIPDAIAKRIVEHEMIPAFKQNDYATGIASGLEVMTALARGEYPYEEYQSRTAGRGGTLTFFPVLLFLIFYFLFLSRRGRYYNAGGRRSRLPFWLILWGLNSGRSGSSGFWNDFNSGSGSFGGGGSGFGGFGGGSFGGGGAGGSW
ncbi:MAG: hypothetical protein CSA95_04760 [Bacteroidetes bacterium]|nr:MAG: hypothetical protein CSA95_04760 [Bacteroidota bacterium]PIE87956.1 MAG: hypothetical protein CSA04_04325 [Bacteroidota bacterium]